MRIKFLFFNPFKFFRLIKRGFLRFSIFHSHWRVVFIGQHSNGKIKKRPTSLFLSLSLSLSLSHTHTHTLTLSLTHFFLSLSLALWLSSTHKSTYANAEACVASQELKKLCAPRVGRKTFARTNERPKERRRPCEQNCVHKNRLKRRQNLSPFLCRPL